MLRNMPITGRMALAMAVPLIMMTLFSGASVYNNFKSYHQLQFVAQIADAVAELGELSHRLQIERGLSARYLGSSKAVIPSKLRDARIETDGELKQFHEIVVELKQSSHDELTSGLEQIEHGLDGLRKFRDGVDKKSTSGQDSMNYYNNVVDHIVELGFHASGFSTSSEISLSIIAMLNLAQLKEYAGRERGLMAGALANGVISGSRFSKFNGYVAKQEISRSNFIANLSDKHRAAYEKMIENSKLEVVTPIRKLLIKNADNLSASGVTGDSWFAATSERINALRQLEKKSAKDLHNEATALASNALRGIWVGVILNGFALAIALFLGVFMAKSISKPIIRLSQIMKQLSENNFDLDIEYLERKDEIGGMARTVEIFRDNGLKVERFNSEKILGEEKNREMIRNLRSNCSSLTTASSEIRTSSNTLSKRTEEQAAAVEETAAAVHEITQTVENATERAEGAGNLVAKTKANAERSGDVVNSAVDAMGRIEKSSSEIANIIGVIDEISFQTNLLALNAGVEAARAGDAGKGFAVVAQEVRELAQRSADAAKEIKVLITASGDQVKTGVELVNETGVSLAAIVAEVQEIDGHVTAIVDAAREQSAALNDINISINRIDEGTQQNAAMAEQSTAASHLLADDLAKINDLMTQFEVDGSNESNKSVEAESDGEQKLAA